MPRRPRGGGGQDAELLRLAGVQVDMVPARVVRRLTPRDRQTLRSYNVAPQIAVAGPLYVAAVYELERLTQVEEAARMLLEAVEECCSPLPEEVHRLHRLLASMVAQP